MEPRIISPVVFLLLSTGTSASSLPTKSIHLISFKTHSRLMIRVDEGTETSFKNTPQGFKLLIKDLALSDLGAPPDEIARWKAEIERLEDTRISQVHLEEKKAGIEVSGAWRFPTGKHELAHPEMETFEYRNTSPPQYVLDFWVKEGKTLEAEKAEERRKFLAQVEKKSKQEDHVKVSRKIASVERHALYGDPSQFCSLPLSEDRDAFMEFNQLHQKLELSKWFPTITPDAGFEYPHPTEKTKEASYIRLALKLYAEAKLGLVIRTLDFFDAEFPRSGFQIPMRFLRANVLFKLGYTSEARQSLSKLRDEAKGSEIALHSSLFEAGHLLSDQNAMPALDHLLTLIRDYPSHPLRWVFHLGAAESLYLMKDTKQAAREYRWVVDNAPDNSAKAEGAFRLSDLYLLRRQYEQALGAQYQALKYFKEDAPKFPLFHINRGETFYQLGQFDRAKEVFESVVEQYPGHPDGWRATFRLGEIEGRNAQNAADFQRSRKWFLETVNHYPATIGATLARIRLIPCGDHAGYNGVLSEKFFATEAREFDGENEVSMKNYEDFRALARVRTLISIGKEEKTEGLATQVTKLAVEEIAQVKRPTSKKVLTLIANDFFRQEILRLLNQGRKFEAIRTYTALVGSLPPTDDFLDLHYLLDLSNASSELGLSGLAVKLKDTYAESERIMKQREDPDFAEKSAEELGDESVEAKFAEAKALWLAQKSADIQGPLKTESLNADFYRIRELLGPVDEVSELAYQKEIILGLMDERDKRYGSAIQHASKAEMLSGSFGRLPTHRAESKGTVLARNLSLQGWIAKLHLKAGDLNTSLILFRGLEKTLAENSSVLPMSGLEQQLRIPPPPSLGAVLLAEAGILEQQGRWGDVAATFSRGLENKWGGTNHLSFEYARALMNTRLAGDHQKALSVLEGIAKAQSESTGQEQTAPNQPLNESESFWKGLAKETLRIEEKKQAIEVF